MVTQFGYGGHYLWSVPKRIQACNHWRRWRFTPCNNTCHPACLHAMAIDAECLEIRKIVCTSISEFLDMVNLISGLIEGFFFHWTCILGHRCRTCIALPSGNSLLLRFCYSALHLFGLGPITLNPHRQCARSCHEVRTSAPLPFPMPVEMRLDGVRYATLPFPGCRLYATLQGIRPSFLQCQAEL